MQFDSLVTALDLIATFAFAIVGARIAASKGLDYGGIALIAAVASISGGTLRNLFMGQRPPWILHSWLFASIGLAVLITIIAKEKKPVGRFLIGLDTFGLAVATVSSANFAARALAPANPPCRGRAPGAALPAEAEAEAAAAASSDSKACPAQPAAMPTARDA
jgi:uncharacterized membrane protein YeiH